MGEAAVNRRGFLKGLMGTAAAAIVAPVIAPRVLMTAQMATELGVSGAVADVVTDLVWVDSAWLRFTAGPPERFGGWAA